MPEIGREEPRPSERFSGGHGISRDRTVLENRSLNRDRAAFNQIETVGWLLESVGVSFEVPEGDTAIPFAHLLMETRRRAVM